MMNRETRVGAFETFKSNWLLQVAADKEAKAAAPVAIVLCCKNLNRGSGQAWPSVAALKKMTGASSENTIRNALKILEARGHAHIVWTKGGSKNTNRVTPLVAGEPFKKLKGSDDVELQGSDAANPAISGEKTLQLSAVEPFKKLKGNHLIEPSEEPLEGDGALYAPVASSIQLDSSNAREASATVEPAPASAPLGGASGASSPSRYISFGSFGEEDDAVAILAADEEIDDFFELIGDEIVIDCENELTRCRLLDRLASDGTSRRRLERLLDAGALTKSGLIRLRSEREGKRNAT